MIDREFPILEFDPDRNALIRPEKLIEAGGSSTRAVLCFFPDAIEKTLSEYPHKETALFQAGGVQIKIFDLETPRGNLLLLQACVGAPLAAAQIEELCAMGVNKIIVCGSCGVLRRDIAVGHLIIPTTAVRDEGTSYHYAPPAREIEADERPIAEIERTLSARSLPYIKAKTWTTDAFYRETPAKIAKRRQEGCVTVEMEASAYIAAARYNHCEFGQILYAGDNLDGQEWDSRSYNSREEIRVVALSAAIDACLNL